MTTAAVPLGVETAERPRRQVSRPVVAVGVGSLLAGAIAGAAAAGGSAGTVVALIAIFVPVAIWYRPQLGPVMLIGVGLLIEQFPLGLTNGSAVMDVPITNSIPLFTGLGPIHLEPADLLPIMIFAIYMIRSAGDVRRWWPHSHVSMAMAALTVCVLFAEGWGIAHHGEIRESLFECRPFFYMAAAYLLTAVLVRTRRAVDAMLWTIVAGNAFKAVQGIYVWYETKDWKPKPQNVLGHEEAMFFALYLFLVAGLWIFGVRGRLRTIGTRLLPLIIFANLVNDRRAAWLILGCGFITLIAVAYVVRPERRLLIRRVVLVTLVATPVYLAAYWNHTGGTLGAPADAIRSQFGTPDARDALSDEYRVDEDANLKYNIKAAGPLGAGFGRQIDYALPMPGLVTAGDSGIMYVPHNSILYILMRFGLVGGAVFWSMLGAAIIAGCRLARSADPKFAVIGAVVAAEVVGWALEGGTDMGFTFPRIAIVMGCLIGLVEACRHISASRSAQAAEVAH